MSLPNDVITDMADCGEEEDDTKRKKRKKETHCRTRGGSSFVSIVTFSLTHFSELTRASSDFMLSRERVVRFRVSREREREREESVDLFF